MDNLQAVEITELNLSKYTYNALRRAGISTLYDLKSLIDEGTIKNIRYIGEEAEQEIIEKLNRYINNNAGIQQRSSPKSADATREEELSPVDIGNDLSVQILEDYLGEQTVNNLLDAKINTLGDLNNLVSAYLQVMNSEESILDHANEELANAAKVLILQKGLQIKAVIAGNTLYNIIYRVPESLDQKLSKYKLLKMMLQTKSLNEELDFIFQDISNREKEIFVRYTLEGTSYRELGSQHGVSVERIRQIYNKTVRKICNKLEGKPNLFLQSVSLIADKLGEELNPQKLENQLKEAGILDSKFKFQNQGMLKICVALIVNQQTSILIDPMLKS